MRAVTQDDFSLTLQHALGRMRDIYGDAELVSQGLDGPERFTNAELVARVDRLAAALKRLGVGRGDRVGTFGWNTHSHLELYWAVPCMGAVLHTLNFRLFAEDLVYIANHAHDRVLFLDASLAEAIEEIRPRLESVEHFIVMNGDAAALDRALSYEDLIEAEDGGFDYPEIDDRQVATLCYTSGTTGKPKGVGISHRGQSLHSVGALGADSFGLSATDRVLPVVPMFHANAWGLAYASGFTGADLVLPGVQPQADGVVGLIADERVTIAAAVPTVWLDVLRVADEGGAQLSSLRSIYCGGAAVPLSLMQGLEQRHGVRLLQVWGMTETGPIASVAHPPANVSEEEAWRYRDTAGRAVPLVETRLVDDDGEVVEHDGEADGELQVRGPWIASAYFGVDAPEKFDDGWLRTGDIASIDREGYIRITDRAKDVIKSGGEWISSVELEKQLIAHPEVVEAAVIAKPDERWTERPLACVVVSDGSRPSPAELRAHLEERVARWWLPDEFAYIDEVPKTGTGKFDKKVLRKQLAEGTLAGLEALDSSATPVAGRG